MTLSVASVCLLWKQQQQKKTLKNLTYLISGASEINKFIFFGLLPATFFLGEWTNIFYARPLKIAHGFFSTFAYCILDAFLKKRIALPIWKSYVRCWRKGRSLNIKVNVTEFYVIKSWWKIKFNKREIYHQLLCLFVFFLSIKPALINFRPSPHEDDCKRKR